MTMILSPLAELLHAHKFLGPVIDGQGMTRDSRVAMMTGGKQVKQVCEILSPNTYSVRAASTGREYVQLKQSGFTRQPLFCTSPKYFKDVQYSIGEIWNQLKLDALGKIYPALRIYREFMETLPCNNEKLNPDDKVAFSVVGYGTDIQDREFFHALIQHIKPQSLQKDRFGGAGKVESSLATIPKMGDISIVSCNTSGNRSLRRYGLEGETQHEVYHSSINDAISVLSYLNSAVGKQVNRKGDTLPLHMRLRQDAYYYSYVQGVAQNNAEIAMDVFAEDESYSIDSLDNQISVQLDSQAVESAHNSLEITPLVNTLRTFAFSKNQVNLTPIGVIEYTPDELKTAVKLWKKALADSDIFFSQVFQHKEIKNSKWWKHTAPMSIWYGLYGDQKQDKEKQKHPAFPILNAFFGRNILDLAVRIFTEHEVNILRTVAGHSSRGLSPFSATCILLARSQNMPNSKGWYLGRTLRLLADAQKEYHRRIHSNWIDKTVPHQMLQTIIQNPHELATLYTRMMPFVQFAEANAPWISKPLREALLATNGIAARLLPEERLNAVVGFNYQTPRNEQEESVNE